jgi:integrase
MFAVQLAARTVRNPKLDTRSARAKLKPRREPYWCSIAPGRSIGYRRLGPEGGTWITKLRVAGSGRWTHALGPADDALEVGCDVLTFAQAQERAREWFAQQERKAIEPEEGAEGSEPAGPFSVENAIHNYLAWLKAHRKPTTAREFRYMAEAHILPALGKIEVTKLSTGRLRTWHEELAAAPARLRTKRGKDQRYRELADDPEATRARKATANRVLTVLKAALNKAVEDRKIASDDAWRLVRPFRGVDAARVRYLQTDECRRLLNACPEDFRSIVRGALLTGSRYGELGRAEVGDFSRDARALQVREAKSGKARWVPLDDEAVNFLGAITAGRPAGDSLCARSDGGRWGKSHQRRPLLEACKAARIEPAIGFHILRHTWASHRVMAGMPLLAVAQVLGHADTRMVEKHYGHLAPSWIHEAVRKTALGLGPHDAGSVAQLRPATG